jgi:hypothetical protein
MEFRNPFDETTGGVAVCETKEFVTVADNR